MVKGEAQVKINKKIFLKNIRIFLKMVDFSALSYILPQRTQRRHKEIVIIKSFLFCIYKII